MLIIEGYLYSYNYLDQLFDAPICSYSSFFFSMSYMFSSLDLITRLDLFPLWFSKTFSSDIGLLRTFLIWKQGIQNSNPFSTNLLVVCLKKISAVVSLLFFIFHVCWVVSSFMPLFLALWVKICFHLSRLHLESRSLENGMVNDHMVLNKGKSVIISFLSKWKIDEQNSLQYLFCHATPLIIF